MRQSLLALGLCVLSLPAVADDSPPAPIDAGVRQARAEAPASRPARDLIVRTSGTLGRSENWRPGLLGQRYVQGRYVHLQIDSDSGVEELFDDSAQGFDGTLNLPLSRLSDALGSPGVDLLIRHHYLGMSSDQFVPPPIGTHLDFDADINQTDIAAAVYVEHAQLGPVRPFVLLGARFAAYDLRIAGGGTTYKDSGDATNLLIAPGVEIDLWEVTAVRATFELDTDELEDTDFLADIILWPWERVFLRGGLIAPFNGSGAGGTIGAGLVF